MSHNKLKAIYARKIREAKAEQTRYQQIISAQPYRSKHQLGIWRAKAVQWKKQAAALERRLGKL